MKVVKGTHPPSVEEEGRRTSLKVRQTCFYLEEANPHLESEWSIRRWGKTWIRSIRSDARSEMSVQAKRRDSELPFAFLTSSMFLMFSLLSLFLMEKWVLPEALDTLAFARLILSSAHLWSPKERTTDLERKCPYIDIELSVTFVLAPRRIFSSLSSASRSLSHNIHQRMCVYRGSYYDKMKRERREKRRKAIYHSASISERLIEERVVNVVSISGRVTLRSPLDMSWYTLSAMY